jgi:hypothetical protein
MPLSQPPSKLFSFREGSLLIETIVRIPVFRRVQMDIAGGGLAHMTRTNNLWATP